MLKYILSALLSLSLTAPAFAQSQGANGAIEGTVGPCLIDVGNLVQAAG